MRLSLDIGSANYVIRAYGQGSITVNETPYTRSLIVMPEHLDADWEPQQPQELSSAHLETLIDLQPEIILLGTGARLQFPEPGLMARFWARESDSKSWTQGPPAGPITSCPRKTARSRPPCS